MVDEALIALMQRETEGTRQSVPGGVKPTFLAQNGHEVVNPKLPDDFAEAVQIAQAEFNTHQPTVGAGSSRGCSLE